jgi:hypothetical protein
VANARLTADLETLLVHANGQPLPLARLVALLGERGPALVIAVLAFPFLQPVPTMGLSTPAGLAVAGFGVCLLLRLPPRMPGILGRRQIAYATLSGIVSGALRLGPRLEKMTRPRLDFLLGTGFRALLGLGLIFSGIALALPIPLPFSNAVPAAAIVLYAMGLIERDGAFVAAGHAVNLALVALGATLAGAGWGIVAS